MNPHQCNQRRILALIASANWGGVSSEDEEILRMFVLTGHLVLAPSYRNHGRIRLRLTDEGWRYLYRLQGNRPFVKLHDEYQKSSGHQ